jgi:hypothetical protein
MRQGIAALALPAMGLCLALQGQPATAQAFTGMQNDMALINGINQMMMAFGGACQMGDGQACGYMQYVQNIGGYMAQASNACLQGDQNGCNAYAQAYQQLNTDYGMFSQSPYAMAGGGAAAVNPPVNPLGETHEDRMNAIRQWGAQNTQNWQQQQLQNDQNHQRFIEMIQQ